MNDLEELCKDELELSELSLVGLIQPWRRTCGCRAPAQSAKSRTDKAVSVFMRQNHNKRPDYKYLNSQRPRALKKLRRTAENEVPNDVRSHLDTPTGSSKIFQVCAKPFRQAA